MGKRKSNRYQEKQRGAVRKYQDNKWCKQCLSPHCHCGVSSRGFFQLTDKQIAEWYGQEYAP